MEERVHCLTLSQRKKGTVTVCWMYLPLTNMKFF